MESRRAAPPTRPFAPRSATVPAAPDGTPDAHRGGAGRVDTEPIRLLSLGSHRRGVAAAAGRRHLLVPFVVVVHVVGVRVQPRQRRRRVPRREPGLAFGFLEQGVGRGAGAGEPVIVVFVVVLCCPIAGSPSRRRAGPRATARVLFSLQRDAIAASSLGAEQCCVAFGFGDLAASYGGSGLVCGGLCYAGIVVWWRLVFV